MKRRSLLALPALLAAPHVVRAQKSYPNEPISLVVGLAPGGSGDGTMRMVAAKATEELGVQMIVDNRPGGAQTIAPTKVMRSKPDGYTLVQTTTSAFGTVPYFQHVPYKVETDFTYIGQYARLPSPNYVLTESPIQSWAQLIDFAKANPGKLRWAAATPFSAPHLANAAAFQQLGLDTIFVPFKGGAEAVSALLAGQIDLVVSSDYGPFLSAGKVRLLSEIGDDRMPGMENIPTFGELGYPLPVRIIFGIAGPANLPQNVVQTWTNTLRKISASPDWTTLLGRYMALPSLVLGDDFRKQMVDDYQRLGNILPGLKIEH